jgi:hypothetical protein
VKAKSLVISLHTGGGIDAQHNTPLHVQKQRKEREEREKVTQKIVRAREKMESTRLKSDPEEYPHISR